MMDIVGHCGDGYEWTVEEYGRKLINVPIAVPDFQIEEKLSLNKGTMGGNFWYLCETQEAVLEGGKRALDAIQSVTGAIAPLTYVLQLQNRKLIILKSDLLQIMFTVLL